MGSGARIRTNGGNVSVASGTFGATSQINTMAASIMTAGTVNGGNIALSALGDMTTGVLDSRAAIGRGGNITLNGGTITTTQDLTTDATTQAGNIFLTAAGTSTSRAALQQMRWGKPEISL